MWYNECLESSLGPASPIIDLKLGCQINTTGALVQSLEAVWYGLVLTVQEALISLFCVRMYTTCRCCWIQ